MCGVGTRELEFSNLDFQLQKHDLALKVKDTKPEMFPLKQYCTDVPLKQYCTDVP